MGLKNILVSTAILTAYIAVALAEEFILEGEDTALKLKKNDFKGLSVSLVEGLVREQVNDLKLQTNYITRSSGIPTRLLKTFAPPPGTCVGIPCHDNYRICRPSCGCIPGPALPDDEQVPMECQLTENVGPGFFNDDSDSGSNDESDSDIANDTGSDHYYDTDDDNSDSK